MQNTAERYGIPSDNIVTFVEDMETGGYAPDATNALRRLNEVTRKWEQREKRKRQQEGPPEIKRQHAKEEFI
jgi:hypothetical protein